LLIYHNTSGKVILLTFLIDILSIRIYSFYFL